MLFIVSTYSAWHALQPQLRHLRQVSRCTSDTVWQLGHISALRTAPASGMLWPLLAWPFAAIRVLHYAEAYDCVAWLLHQHRPQRPRVTLPKGKG